MPEIPSIEQIQNDLQQPQNYINTSILSPNGWALLKELEAEWPQPEKTQASMQENTFKLNYNDETDSTQVPILNTVAHQKPSAAPCTFTNTSSKEPIILIDLAQEEVTSSKLISWTSRLPSPVPETQATLAVHHEIQNASTHQSSKQISMPRVIKIKKVQTSSVLPKLRQQLIGKTEFQ